MPGPQPSGAPLAIIIPAGGGGTRLWPRSRQSTPKQFLDIVEPGRSMLQVTVARVVPDIAPASSVYIISANQHAGTVRAQLPDVPPENIFGEPTGRDSAPAIGLMAAVIESRLGPDALLVVLSADHAIQDVVAFRDRLRAAVDAAGRGYLVTLGIPPTGPDTGFGYIQRGAHLFDSCGTAVFDVRRFREKPDRTTAEEYISSGEYYWNAGMYIARASTFRDLYRRFMPEMEPYLMQLVESVGSDTQTATFERVYPQLTKISFDFAIAEKAERVAVVPAQIGWNDVGTWGRLAEILQHRSDTDGNVVVAQANKTVDSHGCLVYAPDKMVVLMGIDDVVVVDTPDAILVAKKDRAENVKQIAESLQNEGRLDLL